jgi:hypothetical protein
MNAFLKIALGFVLGVVFTFGVLYVIGIIQNNEENQLIEEIRIRTLKNLEETLEKSDSNEYGQTNFQAFELTTKKGIVKLSTYMPKDSVQILMGRPQSTDIVANEYNGDVSETWKYKGRNRYTDEFTIEFTNGKLKSVRQYTDY